MRRFLGLTLTGFLTACGAPQTNQTSELDGTNGFVIYGAAANVNSGHSVSAAGDINNDGYDDIAIGAQQGVPVGGVNGTSGGAYVVYGGPGPFPNPLDLATLTPAQGFSIPGEFPEGVMGFAVAGGGDINNDGLEDLVVSAPYADLGSSLAERGAGRIYVIYGQTGNFPPVFDVTTLNGSNGFTVSGYRRYNSTGRDLRFLPDFNGDGINDLLIGEDSYNMWLSPTGDARILYGKSTPFPANMPASALDGANGVWFKGEQSGDLFGYSIGGEDVNGDCLTDIVIGAPGADSFNVNNAGEAYLFLARQGSWPSPVTPAILNGTNGFRMTGLSNNGNFGGGVTITRDVTGDGLGDIFVADPKQSAYLIPGSTAPYPATISISALSPTYGTNIPKASGHNGIGHDVSPAGDVDGDGLGDFLLTSQGDNSTASSAYVVLGQPGGFGPSFDLAAMTGAQGRRISNLKATGAVFPISGLGDINGDGNDDFAFGSRNANAGGRLSGGLTHVILGQSSGNSNPPPVSGGSSGVFTDSGQNLGSGNTQEIALADLDGDGDLDAFDANYNGAASDVWLNDGTGQFTLGASYPGPAATSVALGDLDGDGDSDAVLSHYGHANTVMLNSGNAIFTAGASLTTSNTYGLALGDLDMDGDLDIYVANSFEADHVWLNDGSANFTLNQSIGNADSSNAAIGDIDGDGDLDIAISVYQQAGTNHTLINDGTGTFTQSSQNLGTGFATDVEFNDLDGDGDLDLVFNGGGPGVGSPAKVWLNTGAGNFTDTGQTIGSDNSAGLGVADIDGDGDDDLFIPNGVNNNSGGNRAGRIWLNDGGALFTDSGQLLGNQISHSTALADLNGDGAIDIYVANSNAANRIWYNSPKACPAPLH